MNQEIRGVPCERCEELTESIECLYGNYWLCPSCVRSHKLAAAWAKIINDWLTRIGHFS
jgi:hypothetical protein